KMSGNQAPAAAAPPPDLPLSYASPQPQAHTPLDPFAALASAAVQQSPEVPAIPAPAAVAVAPVAAAPVAVAAPPAPAPVPAPRPADPNLPAPGDAFAALLVAEQQPASQPALAVQQFGVEDPEPEPVLVQAPPPARAPQPAPVAVAVAAAPKPKPEALAATAV